MAPWEENTYTQSPFAGTQGGPQTNVQLLPADPMRVGIIFSATGSPNTTLFPAQMRGSGVGITIQSSTPVYITQRDYPGWAALEWRCTVPAGASVNALALSLLSWPAGEETDRTMGDWSKDDASGQA